MATSKRRRVVIGAIAVLSLPILVACNSIIGLTDFDKGQCPGARCVDDGSFPDQINNEGGADVVQDAGPDVKGADPVSWAQWPMPNYVEAGPGQPVASPPLVVGSGIVTDTVTKLVWRQTLAPSNPDPTADQADVECQKLSGGPWRAPKRIELVTLLDYSSPNFVDRTKFTDLKNNVVWTTSEVRPFVPTDPNRRYWTVNFSTGAVEPLKGSESAKVLCVRAK